ncbi:MAG: aldehyde dehydrogenase family protein [Gemmatimonadota bacterium]
MHDFLNRLGINEMNLGGFAGDWVGSGPLLGVFSPVDGSKIASVQQVTEEEFDLIVDKAHAAFLKWRTVPAPKRGEVVRQLGNALREKKGDLAALVTLEMGKIVAEGEGEVQEMIDICDFAVGLSRQLYGLTMQSERPDHHMREQWHPLGVVAVISAFNFPVAVWAWNSALAAVCGDSTLWKPASKTPLTAIAVTKIAAEVCRANDVDPAIFSLVIGKGSTVGDRLLHDRRIPLVSATAGCDVGRRVAEVVGGRLARTILELGGNNAIIVTPSADMDMVLPAILFGAVGTAGQRCTSTRRIIVHASMKDGLLRRLIPAYESIRIGNPLDRNSVMGPVVTAQAVRDVEKAMERVVASGGRILYGGERLEGEGYPGGLYITPCIAEAENHWEVVQEETFAPILYILTYGKPDSSPRQAVDEIEEAIAIHNGVPQGLSSSIFTENFREAETFLSHRGSDCGIANVNIGTSGAEIGGAFGGEKDTGGGRESGSDSWKSYMRRQTNTVNWSTELPLAQGLKFGGG